MSYLEKNNHKTDAFLALSKKDQKSYSDRMSDFLESSAMKTTSFKGSVKTKVQVGMKCQINPDEIQGKIHAGKEFIIDGLPRELCGTEVVSLKNLDGSRFSAAYDLSMLQITDANINQP